MKKNQIYSNGIITNHKPFDDDSDPFPVATIVLGVAVVVALIALSIIYLHYGAL